MARQEPFTFRYFVNGVPLEELDKQTRAELPHKLAKQLGDAANSYFGRHPDEYIKYAESVRRRSAPQCAGA